MSLPDDYLAYPKRAYGQDIARHDWALAKDRTPLRWPDERAVAVMVVIPVEWFPLNPSGKPFTHPAGMKTPYPDLRHFTSRDYGARVGVFRLLDALADAKLTATFPLSGALLQRAPPLLEAIQGGGHEIAAAGLHTDAIHWGGIAPEQERAYIAQTRDAFEARGLTPTTWMSPARQQSFETLDLLAEHGFTRCLDWETDQVPIRARTRAADVVTLPLSNELEDQKLLVDRRQSEEVWTRQILEAVDFLAGEHPRYGAQMLGFQLTPFVTGQPFRIQAVRYILQALAENTGIWCARADEIAAAFDAQADTAP